jgi:squalene-hopene/tetraprenyl-beta-curcumene cyclase
MTLLHAACCVVAFAGDPPAPDVAQTRKIVERSLSFLEDESVTWLETRKCASCHHVPMMIWTHHAARQYGFTLNEEALQKLEAAAIDQYLSHPEFQPTGQDKGFLEKPLGVGTIYLSLGLATNPAPADASKSALEKLRTNFVKHQNEDGSWTTKESSPPLVDGHDVVTMLIVLASGQDQPSESRAKAIGWLKQAPHRPDSQALALRLLVAVACGQTQETAENVDQLRKQQHEDGGWSQTSRLPSDALATGQALYALAAAGVDTSDLAVDRARAYLAKTQQPDGSWLVNTRNPNSKGWVISYYGTGWATLGLLHTLPAITSHGK